MFYYFYIKKMAAGRYRMGVAPNFKTARNYGGRGRLVFTVRGWDAEIVLPYLRWAEHKMRSFKQGEEFSITSITAKRYLEEVKMQLRPRRLSFAGIILYLFIQFHWWLARGTAWAVMRPFIWNPAHRAAALYRWEEQVPYPVPPQCKAKREPFHFTGFVWPYWVRLGAWYIYVAGFYLFQFIIFVFYRLPKKILNERTTRSPKENNAVKEATAA